MHKALSGRVRRERALRSIHESTALDLARPAKEQVKR